MGECECSDHLGFQGFSELIKVKLDATQDTDILSMYTEI